MRDDQELGIDPPEDETDDDDLDTPAVMHEDAEVEPDSPTTLDLDTQEELA